jgi:hypothetical protein
MTTEDAVDDVGTYELRVRGHLGPVVLSALPHSAVTRVPEHTMLVLTSDADDSRLVDVVRRLLDAGLEIESVRRSSTGSAADTRGAPEP